MHAADDASTIISNCKSLRPVSVKDLTDKLNKIQKIEKQNPVSLFESDDFIPREKHQDDLKI
jgi:hypothetical protein